MYDLDLSMGHGAWKSSRQEAAGSWQIQEGVRSQNLESRRKKHKEYSSFLATGYWLLTTGYYECAFAYASEYGQQIRRILRRLPVK